MRTGKSVAMRAAQKLRGRLFGSRRPQPCSGSDANLTPSTGSQRLPTSQGSRVETTIPALIDAAERGEGSASEALFRALYDELHRLARRELAQRGAGASLGVTTLLHEAYLDMADRTAASFPDEARFMRYAARVMRGLIIDHVRSGRASKRGGQFEITALDTKAAEKAGQEKELTRISEALDELAKVDASLAEIVDLKFFCGFSFAELAAMRGVSERTIQRQWEKARIYLHRSIRSETTI